MMTTICTGTRERRRQENALQPPIRKDTAATRDDTARSPNAADSTSTRMNGDTKKTNKAAIESYLSKHGPSTTRQTVSAYIEPPLKDRPINAKDKSDIGTPPRFVVPLPLRTHTPDELPKLGKSS
mmetsp:Transcript_12308/g.26609  ORF Transcript_12308/g.26609 Transcript_12308/m.26609 type:complete len:125 (-) Transcript_12308:420-794(-)